MDDVDTGTVEPMEFCLYDRCLDEGRRPYLAKCGADDCPHFGECGPGPDLPIPALIDGMMVLMLMAAAIVLTLLHVYA